MIENKVEWTSCQPWYQQFFCLVCFKISSWLLERANIRVWRKWNENSCFLHLLVCLLIRGIPWVRAWTQTRVSDWEKATYTLMIIKWYNFIYLAAVHENYTSSVINRRDWHFMKRFAKTILNNSTYHLLDKIPNRFSIWRRTGDYR